MRDLGYEFEMLNFATVTGKPLTDYIEVCKKKVNPDLSVPHGVRGMLAAFKMIECLDEANDFYLAHAGRERERGSFARALSAYHDEMRTAENEHDIADIHRRGMEALHALPLRTDGCPVRVGIVGEYFTAVDPHSNLRLERKLLDMGVEVHRMLNMTNRNLRYNEKNLRASASDYLTYDMGPTSSMTVAATLKYAQEGFDGVVHAKSNGCTPEVDCVPVLQRISRETGLPILYLSYDSQTSDTGLDTRLEAFYDMLAMKKGLLALRPRSRSSASMTSAYLGIDIGSISTKGVMIDERRSIVARSYLWTEGDPAGAARRVIADVRSQIGDSALHVRAVGTTGSARRLVGAMTGAAVIKNEITAHAVGTTYLHPDVRTILEIGGQDSKIICVEGGIAVDYAMNTLCAAGTGAFLSSQAHRLGVEVEAVRRDSSRVEEAGEHRRTLHRVRRERPCPQDPGGLRARGHRRGAVPCRGDELPEQRRQGQEDRRARGVPRWREQEPRRGEGVRGRAGNGSAGRPRRAPDGRVRGRAAGRRGRAAHANGRC